MHGLKLESDNYFVTALANHYCPAVLANDWKEGMSESEAKALIVKCLQVMFYRDKKANDKVQIATVTKDGTKIEEPEIFPTEWNLDYYSGKGTNEHWRPFRIPPTM